MLQLISSKLHRQRSPLDAGNLEVPDVMRVRKRSERASGSWNETLGDPSRHEATRRGVDMDRYKVACLLLVCGELLIHLSHRLENTGVRRAKNAKIVSWDMQYTAHTKTPIVFSSTYFIASLADMTKLLYQSVLYPNHPHSPPG